MIATTAALGEWADTQLRISATRMGTAVSATSLVRHRPGFGQTVRPARGSVLGAAAIDDASDAPDYFFHWLRDSAAVMDAGLVLIRNGIDAGAWTQRFAEFARFSLGLARIDGAHFLSAHPNLRERTEPQFRQYLRPPEEIAAVSGERVLGEVRYNADGTLDFLRWSRPQHDGPALRALTALRFLEAGAVMERARGDADALLRLDLDYTMRHAGERCYDIWEEEDARHYCTGLLQAAALRAGRSWASAKGEPAYASELAAAAERLTDSLDDFWSAEKGIIVSRLVEPKGTSGKEFDCAVILGLIHAGPVADGGHEERALKTVEALAALFAAEFAINRGGAPGVAFGRYQGDSYFGGGPWFICTFGAAEFHYRRAALTGAGAQALAVGDTILTMARRSIPASGEISEQFDQATGRQRSARDMPWSHAAFITAWQARKDAIRAISKQAEHR